MRSLKVLLVAACFSGAAMSQSQAADLPKQGKFTAKFGWYAVGKVFELEKDHLFWVGEFSGTGIQRFRFGIHAHGVDGMPGIERHPS